ncbi:hypothetical protein HYV43_05840 [Candidatus Micrarchaeota archaeon]|nr:hypothetical protein [Candidatus Micrarchaeota archaeon]
MTLDQLRKEIRLEAARTRREALKEAETEASRIVSEAEASAKSILDQARIKAKDEAAQKMSQVSAARLEGKKRIAEARDAVVAEQLDEVKAALQEFADSAKYDTVLKGLAEHGADALGGSVRILARRKDAAKLKKWGYADVAEHECWGGCIVSTADGRIRVNHTFEALYEQSLEKLRQAIFEEL